MFPTNCENILLIKGWITPAARLIIPRPKARHALAKAGVERYHRSMKNVVLLQHYYLPQELESEVAVFVEYYNHHRVHESRQNVKPADVFFDRQQEISSERKLIKRRTLAGRRKLNLSRLKLLDSEGRVG